MKLKEMFLKVFAKSFDEQCEKKKPEELGDRIIAEVPMILVNAMIFEVEENPSDYTKVIPELDEKMIGNVYRHIREGRAYIATGIPWEQGMPRTNRRDFKKCIHTDEIQKVWCKDGKKGKEYFVVTKKGKNYQLIP